MRKHLTPSFRWLKALLSTNYLVQTSQLHHLWRFLSISKPLPAVSYIVGTKKHYKRCNCDVIKGHLVSNQNIFFRMFVGLNFCSQDISTFGFKHGLFNQKAIVIFSTPDFSTVNFSIMNYSTLTFSTPNFSTPKDHFYPSLFLYGLSPSACSTL